jgi:hypothetical protein
MPLQAFSAPFRADSYLPKTAPSEFVISHSYGEPKRWAWFSPTTGSGATHAVGERGDLVTLGKSLDLSGYDPELLVALEPRRQEACGPRARRPHLGRVPDDRSGELMPCYPFASGVIRDVSLASAAASARRTPSNLRCFALSRSGSCQGACGATVGEGGKSRSVVDSTASNSAHRIAPPIPRHTPPET